MRKLLAVNIFVAALTLGGGDLEVHKADAEFRISGFVAGDADDSLVRS